MANRPLSYILSPHVRACRVGTHIVILDMRRDQYLGFSDCEELALRDLIEGWPTPLKHEHSERNPAEVAAVRQSTHELLQCLIDDDIVTRNSNHVLSSYYMAPPAQLPLIEGYTHVPVTIKIIDVVTFFYAAVTASLLLKYRSIESIIRRIGARRVRQPRPKNECRDMKLDMRLLVAVFMRLRPLAFTANNRCLFDSLALSEFLAVRGVYPNWIFGVTANPFSAHCWLQHEGIVLNDNPENVQRYTPIMVI